MTTKCKCMFHLECQNDTINNIFCEQHKNKCMFHLKGQCQNDRIADNVYCQRHENKCKFYCSCCELPCCGEKSQPDKPCCEIHDKNGDGAMVEKCKTDGCNLIICRCHWLDVKNLPQRVINPRYKKMSHCFIHSNYQLQIKDLEIEYNDYKDKCDEGDPALLAYSNPPNSCKINRQLTRYKFTGKLQETNRKIKHLSPEKEVTSVREYYLYFITSPNDIKLGGIKIGYTYRPAERLNDFKTGRCPYPDRNADLKYFIVATIKPTTKQEAEKIEEICHNKIPFERLAFDTEYDSEWFIFPVGIKPNDLYNGIKNFLEESEFKDKLSYVGIPSELVKFSL